MEELKIKKTELRKRLIEQRNSISQYEVKVGEIRFTINFLKYSKLVDIIKNAQTPVAIYYPSKNELSPIALVQNLHKKYNTRFCLPAVTEKEAELKFVEWNLEKKELQESKFYSDILEPEVSKTHSGQPQFTTPTILIIPLVGFDKNCGRIGMGGGFYDRTIASLRKQNPEIITIGIGYEMQKVDEIPIEENDEVLDFVVTEERAYNK